MNAPVSFTTEEWTALQDKFSETKHTLNNALAVFLALSELAHRDPENYVKLGKTIDARTPIIIGLMEEITTMLDAKRPC